MKKENSQLMNALLIIIGGGLLVVDISGSQENVYVLIVGLVMLMLGLYRATNHWVETKDDHQQQNDETNSSE